MPVYRATNKIIIASKLPNKIAGVNLWLDGNDMSTINSGGIIADGTAVTTIKDKIGGVVFTGTGPFKKDTVVSGKNTILLNGTSDYIEAANVAGVTGTTKTVFLVIKNLTLTPVGYDLNIVNSAWASTVVPNFTIANWANGAGWRCMGSNNSVSPSWSYFPITTPATVKMICFVVRKDTSKMKVACDGVNSALASAAMTDCTSSNYFTIGGKASGLALSSFNLCEVIHANTVLSDANYNAIRQYLFNKWGV